jgi:two-component system, OmpR family, sensor histidine kinase KdpD
MRPDPDELLVRVQEQEARQTRGGLKVFFGMAAGVGKTYAMLNAARRLRQSGVDVVVGYVESHGRRETEALLEGLDSIPVRRVEYRGATMREFDLDRALERHPAVILVDELAHTNAAGLRHAKRWQDIEELLQAGIDVFTTVNVQHLESLNDVVSRVTGVAVRETVPDSVIDQASEIELIDLPPDELLQRLAEGKVYVPEQARHAAERFFRKGNLIALRELALRRTADRVDAQMRGYRLDHTVAETWPISERLMVCIGPSPFAKQLVRSGKRLATQLRAEWIVANVQTPRWESLPGQARSRVYEALRLAEQLGAQTVTLSGANVSVEVLDYARSRNVGKILVGKPAGPVWKRVLFGSILDELVAGGGEIDVYACSSRREESPAAVTSRPNDVAWRQYAAACLAVAACTGVGLLLHTKVDHANIVMVYLLAVVAVAMRAGRGPSIFTAVMSVAAFDFFFTTPYYTLIVSHVQFVITLAIMLAVSLIISGLTVRVRSQAAYALERERRTQALYRMSRSMAGTAAQSELLAAAARHALETFGGDVALALPDEGGKIAVSASLPGGEWLDSREIAVAQWVYDHGLRAGHGSATLAAAAAVHIPMIGSKGKTLGTLLIRPALEGSFEDPERVHLLEAFANQAATALERVELAEAAKRTEVDMQAERARSALLSAVSHDLRTPLATIQGAVSGVLEHSERLPPEKQRELLQTAYDETEHLNRLVHNLLDLTRAESGGLRLRREWQSMEEITGAALARLDHRLAGRTVTVDVPPDLPLLFVDAILIEQVLLNLLENADRYSPPEAAILVQARPAPGAVTVEVSDGGPGFAPGEEQLVFDKFYRGSAAKGRGAGIGLTICAAIVEAHGGRIQAANRPQGGALMRFTLPLVEVPPNDEPPPGDALSADAPSTDRPAPQPTATQARQERTP